MNTTDRSCRAAKARTYRPALITVLVLIAMVPRVGAHEAHVAADDPILKALEAAHGVGGVGGVGGIGAAVAAPAAPFPGARPGALAPAARLGRWSAVDDWPLLAVHAALLPTGRVLAWDATPDDFDDDPHTTENYTTRVTSWDPLTNAHAATDNGTDTDLFCAGSALLWDGRVLFAGGDGGRSGKNGPLSNSNLYDPYTNRWTRTDDLAAPRWYSSVAALGNGEMLTFGGTYSPTPIAEVFQFNKQWRPLPISTQFTFSGDYSWLQATSDGDVMYFGPHDTLSRLDTDDQGEWTVGAARDNEGYRGYGSYAMYDVDHVLVAGGGDSLPSSVVIDTRTASTTASGAMAHGRRQHNLTLLADGTVMANGGNTSGADQYDPQAGVLEAERWNPATGQWTPLAAAAVDRQYHAISLLLPDGRVLTGGGGYCPICSVEGYHEQNAEIFSPPYLFAADGTLAERPVIDTAPALIDYAGRFSIRTDQAARIARAHLIRLGSVTHSQNQSQRLVPLDFANAGGTLLLDAPAGRDIAPPGHYLLIVVDTDGVPSVGEIVQVGQSLIRADEVVVNRLQAARTDYYAIDAPGEHELVVDVRSEGAPLDVVIGSGRMPREGEGRDQAVCEAPVARPDTLVCQVSASVDTTWYIGVSGAGGTDYTLLAHLGEFEAVSIGKGDAGTLSTPRITRSYALGSTAVELTWSPGEATLQRDGVGYEIYRDGHLVNYETGPRHVESSLMPGTAYRFQVVATDGDGLRSAPSETVTVTTRTTTFDYDTYYNPAIPSTPVGLRQARYGQTAVELFWGASRDDLAVIGYEVHRDGQLLDFVGGPSYFDGALTPDATYSYTVFAVDSDQNRSLSSVAILVSTGNAPAAPIGGTQDTIDVDAPTDAGPIARPIARPIAGPIAGPVIGPVAGPIVGPGNRPAPNGSDPVPGTDGDVTGDGDVTETADPPAKRSGSGAGGPVLLIGLMLLMVSRSRRDTSIAP